MPKLPALALAAGLLAALPALAQQGRPAGLQPVPEPPPMPAAVEAPEPQVTISRRGEDMAEEYRINGRLYMIKITPRHGVPYYLIDQTGNGVMTRVESLDSGLRVPMWVIHAF